MGVTSKLLNIVAVIVLVISATYYLYYNSAFMQQVFANVFYKEVTATKEKIVGDFSQININIYRTDTFLDRNKYILRGGCIQRVNYSFNLNDKKYYASKNSYIKETARCNYVFNKVYYFPLNPNWAIVEIDMPDKKYIDNFYSSSIKLFLVFSVFFLVLYRQKLFQILKKFNFFSENRETKK